MVSRKSDGCSRIMTNKREKELLCCLLLVNNEKLNLNGSGKGEINNHKTILLFGYFTDKNRRIVFVLLELSH
jgi:hypothetical protein